MGESSRTEEVSRVRVSVGELAPIVFIEETGEKCFLVVLNSGARKKGRDLLQPFGGAVKLTAAGCAYFVEKFGVLPDSFHEKDDARFEIDEEHLEEVMSIFENFKEHTDLITVDVTRELIEELSEPELEGIPPILSAKEASQIGVKYLGSSRQPVSDSSDPSPLAKAEAPSRRLFFIFSMTVSRVLFEKITKSPAVRVLTPEEVASTKGGLCKGQTADGKAIANNVYDYGL